MKRRNLLAATAAVTTLPLPLQAHANAQGNAQPASFNAEDLAHAAHLRDLGLQDTNAWQLVQQLCTQVGARPAGSPGDAKAVAWAQAALLRLGLSNVRAEAVPLRIWQRGPASARLVGPVIEPLVMAALGNSVAAPEGGIEADIAWYPDFAALKADTSDSARGRIVFIDQKTERTRDGRGYGSAVVARAQGAIEAGKRGALAMGIRSIGTSGARAGGKDGSERIAHTGAMRYELGLPRIPAFAVSVPDADRLAALHAEGKPLRLQLHLQARSDVEATTHNVIAEVPGGDLAHEVVLIGAHLDSWDLGV
ncbi:MAG TPA: hypothetical protein VK439_12575, partial [Rubrivivax sp.]|nr:hypothetical protein [Rubrivivax sp.]